MILRTLTRVSAAALLTAGVVASAASPALAAPKEADIKVTVSGLPLDSREPAKAATFKVTNKTSKRIDNVLVKFDFTQLDLTRVSNQLGIPGNQGCETVEGTLVYVCDYGPLARNGSMEEQLPLYAVEGVPAGPAGSVHLEVSFGGRDTHDEDNSIEVPIEIVGPPAPTPTVTPTATPTATPTGTPTAQPTVSPSVTPTPGDGGTGGGDGGGLPVTGPAAIGIGVAGAAAIALGVFLFVVARRRKTRLVTPDDIA
ncbi:hypothetical protein [Spirilliplanes yamanashiensis]|uniref:LPXTG-motif cell wall anchor domain-containing protein n=1 Tax=Spirilliplanes yamanashiensis TaxID=42233 RepID=A0A8J3Y846_9ACTN|nr:hypothetical protein [Spirilliplanes yamanashiensis]MDP9815363.1 hypothetical protein [Spirilliplanes yamanashiensis]GIJ03618.1 hypothetical protein Sya03_29700 [Spirilliplanes yamanashiensis]